MLQNNIDFSRDKYTKANLLSRFLLDRFFETVIQTVPSGVSSILEVGCGEGFSTKRLSRALSGKKFFASDHDENLLDTARKLNPGINITKESLYQLKRDSGSFDIVISLEVFEHLKNPHDAIKEILRVSSRYVLVSVPNEPLWRILNLCRGKYITKLGNTPGHINHWSPEGFKRFVKVYSRVVCKKNPTPWTVLLAEKTKNF